MKKKLIWLLCCVLMTAFIASGCSKKEEGTLVIGLDDTFAPMGFRDTDNNLVGFDIDLANEVAKILGVKVEFKPIVWDTKEAELEAGTVDCLWNGLSATEKRQEEMTMTKKYLNNRLVVMTLKSDVVIDSAADLANYQIGTQDRSSALEVMEAHDEYESFGDNITTYPTYDEAILDMQAGRVDCIVVDEVLGEYKNTKMDEKMSICNFNFGDDFYAIGCKKGNTELADQINDALAQLIENGKAAEISEKWFGTNIVILE